MSIKEAATLSKEKYCSAHCRDIAGSPQCPPAFRELISRYASDSVSGAIVLQMNIPRAQIVRVSIRAPDNNRKSTSLSLCNRRSKVFFVTWLDKHIMSAQERGHFLPRN